MKRLPEAVAHLTSLPIFPLPSVLLPGMLMPLHIFEPRYRQLLHDCLSESRVFGLTYHPQSAVGTLAIPAEGSLGCGARITSVSPLPDGRSNITTVGVCRYSIVEYTSQDPYLVAKVEFFMDEADEAELPADLVQQVLELFRRFVGAMRTLRDEPNTPFRLPEDPELSSFAISSVVISEPEELMEVLQMRSTQVRLQHLRQHMDAIIDRVESMAEDHVAVRGNGRQEKSLLHE